MAFFGNKRKDFSIQPPKQQVNGTPFYVTDSANIDFTLANLNLTANLTQLLPTSGTYGDATHIPILQIDQWGRITGVTTTTFSASGILLQTNNTDNDSQTILNLVNGTDIEVTDLGGGKVQFNYTGTGGTGTVFSVLAGTGMNFTTITTSGSVDIDTTKVPYLVAGFSTGLLKWDGSAWVFDTNTYLTTIGSGTTNTITKWSSTSNTLVDSSISDNGAGDITITSTSDSRLYFKAGASSANSFIFQKNSLTNFVLAVDASKDFVINSYNPSTGGFLGNAFKITTNTTDVTLPSLAGTGSRMVTADANGLLSTAAIPSGSGGLLHGTTLGTDTYTTTIVGATAYADGDAYLIRFAIGNTTSATLNISDGISSFGAVPLYRNNDGPLLGGDVIAGGEMVCVYNSTLNIFQCIGVSPNSLIAYVTNDDSVTITKGQPVYAFSGTGDRMTVKLAYNTGDSTSAQTVGLVLSTSIAANQKGLIMMQGLLDGLSNVKPVNGWADGSPVYLGTTAGSITPTKQYAPNHLVYLGFVTTASPGAAGRVYVRVQNGYELDELHNVQAQTPANNDTLYYDNTVTPKQWKTASISTILGYTPLSQTLANTQLFVGNASNVATAVAMSGDTTIANTGAVTIANNAVTYSKMQAVSATSKLLGSSSTTTPVQEITIGGGLTLTGTTLTASFLITYRRLTSSSTLDSTDLTNVNTGTTYIIEMNVGTANTLTVPLNATIGFSIGSQITISQYGAGQTTIAAAVGVTLRSPGSFLKLAAQYSMCTLMKVDTNEWYVVGQLAP